MTKTYKIFLQLNFLDWNKKLVFLNAAIKFIHRLSQNFLSALEKQINELEGQMPRELAPADTVS
jgi:hypothetical protein